MTLKNSFIKLQIEDMKRRMWSVILSMLAFIVLLPIFCAIVISNFKGEDYSEWEKLQIIGFVGPGNYILIAATIICAIVCGLSGFYYLHSRKKVDFYHSLPVRRENLFFTSYLNGVLIYFIPYLINLLISLLILSVNHYMNTDIFAAAIKAVGINLLFFCMSYTITIIAVMMTGNLIISICGTGVFLLYVPVVRELKDALCASFFATYAHYTGGRNTSFLSPIESYINIADHNLKGNEYAWAIISSVVATIILLGCALLLYKKRSSEAAGKSMAFRLSKPIIKFLLVIPLSLGGGILLKSIVSSEHDGWFIFGTVFAFVVSYGLIQVLFEFDIRSSFGHWKQMLISAAVVGALAVVLRFDVFGYDGYLPELNDVESMSVSMSGIDQGIYNYELVDGKPEYRRTFEYELNKMKLTDVQAAYKMAEIGVKNRIKKKDRNDYYAYYSENNVFTYYVKYTLKSGREVYRCYGITLEECKDSLNEIYTDQAYKKVHYPIYKWQEKDIKEIWVNYVTELLNYDSKGTNSKEGINFSLSGDSLAQLFEVYKEELGKVTIEEVTQENPVIELTFKVGDQLLNHYYVYPSCVKTLAYLEQNGFDIKKSVLPENVVELTISNYKKTKTIILENGESTVSMAAEPVTYTEQKDIIGILPALVQRDYSQFNKLLIGAEDNVDVNLTYRFGNSGLVQSFDYSIRKDKLPEQVKKDLGL